MDTPSDLRQNEPRLSNRLQSEAQVMLYGGAGAIGKSWTEIKEHPKASLITAGSSAALTAGLLAIESEAPYASKIMKVAGAAMAYSFAKYAFTQASDGGSAIKDTWLHPDHAHNNQERLTTSLAPLVADLALTAGGVLIGGGATSIVSQRIASRSVDVPVLKVGAEPSIDAVETVSRGSQLNKLYQEASKSVAKLEVLDNQGQPTSATGFSVGPGILATAAHSVGNASDITVRSSAGRMFGGEVIGIDMKHDVALLRVTGNGAEKAFKPVELADSRTALDITPTTAGFTGVGFPLGWNRPFASPGSFIMRESSLSAALERPVSEGEYLAQMQMNLVAGTSGGPVFNPAGKVVASVHGGHTGIYDNWDARVVPSEHLIDLMNRTDMSTVASAVERTTESGIGANRSKWWQRFSEKDATQQTVAHISDKEAAHQNITEMFGDLTKPENIAFHSRYSVLNVKGGKDYTIQLKAQYNPLDSEIQVRPTHLNGGLLDYKSVWPGTETPFHASSVKVQFDEFKHPVRLVSSNDPEGILPHIFAPYGNGYLSKLNLKS